MWGSEARGYSVPVTRDASGLGEAVGCVVDLDSHRCSVYVDALMTVHN